MAGKTNVRLYRRAHNEIRNSAKTMAELERRANLILTAVNVASPGRGYAVASAKHRHSRGRAAVLAVTMYARRSNAKHNTLLKALSAGRG
jgi:hypothetical protein